MSAKILEKLAFRPAIAEDPSAVWGTSDLTPGAGHLIPFTSLEKGMTVTHAEDNSIGPAGFSDTPVQTGLMAEKSFSMNAWFTGLNAMLYWAFGFENEVIPVFLFTISGVSTEPVGGAVYEDTDNTQFTFLRKEVQRNATYYVFTCDTAPVAAPAALSKLSGTGDSSLSYSAVSGQFYEHLFELDALTRNIIAFPTAERVVTGWNSNMRKNRTATLGIYTSVTDLIYRDAMCKKFGFKSSAGQICSCDFDYLAHHEDRGDYDSDTWTLPVAFAQNSLEMIHHQLRFKIGTNESSLVNLGIADINYGLEIPLDSIQDTESGLYLAEPMFEGKYKNSLDAKLSRYAAETYAGYRDNWTTVCGILEAFTGYYGFELFFNNMKIVSSGPDSSNVEAEPLKFEFGHASNAFPIKLYGNTLLQGGPVVCRVRNAVATNYMFLDA